MPDHRPGGPYATNESKYASRDEVKRIQVGRDDIGGPETLSAHPPDAHYGPTSNTSLLATTC